MRTMMTARTGTQAARSPVAWRRDRHRNIFLPAPILAFAAMISAAGPVAMAQDRPIVPPRPVPALSADGPVSQIAPQRETGPAATRQALEREISRLEADIAALARLIDWQEQLTRAAGTDPVAARRQRRARSGCLETPLAPFCDRLAGMYREEGQ